MFNSCNGQFKGITDVVIKSYEEVGMSKECKSYSVDLSAYFDGELEGEALEKMQIHLKGCKDCKQKLDKFGKLHNAMAGLSGPSRQGRSILDDIKAKLEQGSQIGKDLPS